MESEEIILSFKGDITQDLLSSVYQIVETRLGNVQEEPRIRKKMYNILVECLQNVYHHMESFKSDNHKTDFDANSSAIFIIGRGKESYKIVTGNFILNSKVEELKGKIDKISAMSHDELRAYYVEQLSSSELSDKGGAGLGMIDIARKSGQKLEYSFQPVSDMYSFFSLAVFVK